MDAMQFPQCYDTRWSLDTEKENGGSTYSSKKVCDSSPGEMGDTHKHPKSSFFLQILPSNMVMEKRKSDPMI